MFLSNSVSAVRNRVAILDLPLFQEQADGAAAIMADTATVPKEPGLSEQEIQKTLDMLQAEVNLFLFSIAICARVSWLGNGKFYMAAAPFPKETLDISLHFSMLQMLEDAMEGGSDADYESEAAPSQVSLYFVICACHSAPG